MQVNSINSTSYQQNFGAIKVDDNAIEILTRKLGSQQNIEKFIKLHAAQNKNPFDVHITKNPNNERLFGFINGSKCYIEHYKGLFKSTIEWIEEMCQIANTQFDNLKRQQFLEFFLKK